MDGRQMRAQLDVRWADKTGAWKGECFESGRITDARRTTQGNRIVTDRSLLKRLMTEARTRNGGWEDSAKRVVLGLHPEGRIIPELVYRQESVIIGDRPYADTQNGVREISRRQLSLSFCGLLNVV